MKNLTILPNQTKKIQFKINGHDVEGVVSIQYDQNDTPEFRYWNNKDIADTKQDIKDGRIQCVYVQVSVMFSGLTGLNSLGQVFVRSSSFEKDLMQTVETHSMVKKAIEQLENQVLACALSFNKFLTKVS